MRQVAIAGVGYTDFSRDSGLFCNGNIGGTGGDDQHLSLEPLVPIVHGNNAGGFMVDGSPVDPLDDRRNLSSRSSGQEGSVMFEQRCGNAADLHRRLALAQNHFRKPLSD